MQAASEKLGLRVYHPQPNCQEKGQECKATSQEGPEYIPPMHFYLKLLKFCECESDDIVRTSWCPFCLQNCFLWGPLTTFFSSHQLISDTAYVKEASTCGAFATLLGSGLQSFPPFSILSWPRGDCPWSRSPGPTSFLLNVKSLGHVSWYLHFTRSQEIWIPLLVSTFCSEYVTLPKSSLIFVSTSVMGVTRDVPNEDVPRWGCTFQRIGIEWIGKYHHFFIKY